ncbi:hypothetical protein FI667_g10169, partial [Globisporangium splendens]
MRGQTASSLRLSLLCCLATLGGLHPVHAVETSFKHRFDYDSSADAAFLNASQAMKGVSFGGPAQLSRWNTHTIISGFGMERGGRLELQVLKLQYPKQQQVTANAHIPVVFTLYDIDQWRVYSVLKLKDVPLRSPAILCHYPSAMRFAVTGDEMEKTMSIAFTVQKASQYTLQAQACGEATVAIEGYAKMMNVGYDNRLSEHLGVEHLGLLPLYKFVWLCFVSRCSGDTVVHGVDAALDPRVLPASPQRGCVKSAFISTLRDLAQSTSSAALLGVLLFASLGWSLTREQLSRRESRLVVVIFTVYFAIALAKALCDSDDDENDDICKAYMLTEYVIKSVVMLGVIVALNFTISQLRLALTEARWNNFVTPLTYMKLNQFQCVPLLLIAVSGAFPHHIPGLPAAPNVFADHQCTIFALATAFLPRKTRSADQIFPLLGLCEQLVVITPPGSWRYDWVNDLLTECSALFIYVNVALILRPLDPYIYSRISKGTNLNNSNASGRNGSATENEVAMTQEVPPIESVAAPAVMPVSSATIESNRRLLEQYPPSASLTGSLPLSPL